MVLKVFVEIFVIKFHSFQIILHGDFNPFQTRSLFLFVPKDLKNHKTKTFLYFVAGGISIIIISQNPIEVNYLALYSKMFLVARDATTMPYKSSLLVA